MAPLSRRVRRIEEPLMAALGLGLPLLAILAAYGYAMTAVPATSEAIVSAAGLVGIAGTGLLYAWRAVTGASDE